MVVGQQNDYDAVDVLFLSWKDGDTRMHEQLVKLKDVFKDIYNYDIEEWLIPSQNPYSSLNQYLLDYKAHHDGPRKLLILYYAGHGSLTQDQDLIWMWYVVSWEKLKRR